MKMTLQVPVLIPLFENPSARQGAIQAAGLSVRLEKTESLLQGTREVRVYGLTHDHVTSSRSTAIGFTRPEA